MKARKLIDKTKILSLDNFNKFSIVTKENLEKFYYSSSIFVVANINKNNVEIEHSFNGREKLKKGYHKYYYLYDNSICQSNIYISKDESDEEYKEYAEDFKHYILDKIKLNKLYAIKI